MARIYLHADEAGNFDFSRNNGASRYFILTTVASYDHICGDELLDLRRRLGWDGVELTGEFHATTDAQAVRDQVFSVISQHDFRVDATILEKAKSIPVTRTYDDVFYRYSWFYHLKYVVPLISTTGDEIMVIAASLGDKKKRAAFYAAVKKVTAQLSPSTPIRTAFWPSCVDPCLQVADYCAWAIQRKWESGDARSHGLIRSKINSEFDLFRSGTTTYY